MTATHHLYSSTSLFAEDGAQNASAMLLTTHDGNPGDNPATLATTLYTDAADEGAPATTAFAAVGAEPKIPAPVADGAATDTLTLGVSEDAWQGDARYTVTVDSKQAGGIYTATASHVAGQVGLQTIAGSWGKGPHTIGVTFINDAWGGSATTDRNLYINSVNYDGTQVGMSTIAQNSAGTATVLVPAVSPPPPAPSDTLTLGVSENAWNGDAQYTVTVDGQQAGGVYTATASHTAGLINQQTISGAWGKGPHAIGVTFINDAWGGSATTDRNLYINSVNYDGNQVAMDTIVQNSNGTATVVAPAAQAASTPNLFLTETGEPGPVSVMDVSQGPKGVCYLDAVIAEEAFLHPAFIQNMITDEGGTQMVMLYAKTGVDSSGQATFKATPQTVSDSSLSPYGANTLPGAHNVVDGVAEIWPQVVEDAYAKANGGWSQIENGGYPEVPMEQFTGQQATFLAPISATASLLAADFAAGDPIVIGTFAGSATYNLLGSHAYMFEGEVNTSAGLAMQLGNPWGFDQPALVPFSALQDCSSGIGYVTVGGNGSPNLNPSYV